MDQTGNCGFITSDCLTAADLVWYGHYFKVLRNEHMNNCGKGHVLDVACETLKAHPKIEAWMTKMDDCCKA